MLILLLFVLVLVLAMILSTLRRGERRLQRIPCVVCGCPLLPAARFCPNCRARQPLRGWAGRRERLWRSAPGDQRSRAMRPEIHRFLAAANAAPPWWRRTDWWVWGALAGCVTVAVLVADLLIAVTSPPKAVPITHGDPAQLAASVRENAYDLCDPIKDAKQRELCRGRPDPAPAPADLWPNTRITRVDNPAPSSWGEVTLVVDNAYMVEYGVVHGWFTLRNDNPFAVKDVPVTCMLTARSGTVLGYLTPTVYDVIPAHGSLRVKDLALGIQPPQTVGVQCFAGRSDRAN